MNVLDFYKYKLEKIKISMITCYDHWSAQIVNESEIDCILVGDSVAMVVYGQDSTLDISTKQIAEHVKAVKRGAPNKFIVGDLPFLSYRKGLKTTMDNVGTLMKAGANAIKLEGAEGNLETIKHITESGVPVMGHLGLTPQMVHKMGGYKVQGKTNEDAEKIKSQALKLQQAGCFALVLECIPTELAEEITKSLSIPTIGIGAGPVTDGQVLVMQDMLGCYTKNPKFVKKFNTLNESLKENFNNYDKSVKDQSFPSKKESYT